MRGLYRRPDPAETRFLARWIVAWLIGLGLYLLSEESSAALHRLVGDNLELNQLGEIASLVIYIVAIVAGLVVPWLTLSPLYQRPSLGAWIGWMIFSVVILIVVFVLAISFLLTLGTAPTTPAYEPDLAFYVFATLSVIATMSGYALAFLVMAWRVGFAVTIAVMGTSVFLVVADLSSVTIGLLEIVRAPDDNEDWGQGTDWSDLPILLAETLIMSLTVGIALVVGYRWQDRDVESRIFD